MPALRLVPTPFPPPAALPATRRIDLAGEWRLSFSGPNTTGPGSPLPTIAFDDTIRLPATTETAGKGAPNPERRITGLTAVRRIEGPVWYGRDFILPGDWAGHPVRLLLERTKHCTVWLDGQPVGVDGRLCAPHTHDLGLLAPGRHRLTLCIDNSHKPVPGDNHQLSEHTQGNWNGVLGRLELQAVPRRRITHVSVTPDVAARTFSLRIELSGPVGPDEKVSVSIAAESANHAGPVSRPAVHQLDLTAGSSVINATFPLGPDAVRWDEFSPALYRLAITLHQPGGHDEYTVTTGLREFTRAGTQFAINGRTTFLRGEVNCCVFPLTGHPPMDVAGWRHYYGTLQAYGINHVRFHSWTPPDAAFTAADALGIYIQCELPFWGEWHAGTRAALEPEGEAILRTYGHHPSFVLFTLGNEHRGERGVMTSLVAALRRRDPSRLFAEGANNFLTEPSLAPDDDFWITARVPARRKPGRFANVRGCHATNDIADGHVQIGTGGTRTDYAAAIAGIPVPVVSHEIGQYTVAPNFDAIGRYTGVFAARNLEHFRAKSEAAGLLDRSARYHRTSAKLAARLYREEIEAALRTRGFGGFQLLGLQDFPGQGTALVGLLDVFLESKGAIRPEEFRRFCAPLVLLVRFDHHTWTAGKEFTADLELAHYGPDDLPEGTIDWRLTNPHGITLARGSIGVEALARGGLRSLGTVTFPLPKVAAAEQVSLSVVHTAGATGTATEHTLWIYPPIPAKELRPRDSVHLARHLDLAALEVLAGGGRVVLLPDSGHPFAHSPGGAFMTDFWCWPLFFNTPGTMGLAINYAHPALRGFPTAEHSDWQWFQLARAAQPVVLDALPSELRPIIEVPDNLDRVHRLGLVFETMVGPGRLLVCGIDLPALTRKHPEARQLLASLLAYAASPEFQPTASIGPIAARLALEAKVPLDRATLSASIARPNRDPFVVFNDHKVSTATDPDSAWWQVELPEPTTLAGVELVWDRQLGGYRLNVEVTADGTNWELLLSAVDAGPRPRRYHRTEFPTASVAGLRLRITNLPARAEIALNELRLLRPAS